MDFIFTTIASVILLISFLNLYKAMVCRSWPVTDGEITHASIDSERVGFYYEYHVNEEKFLGRRIFFGDIFLSWIRFDASRRVVNKYEFGQKVKVHYNPSNLNDSVLETGIKWQAYFPVGLGVVFFIVAGLV